MAAILDFVGLQDDTFAALLNRVELNFVQIVQYRQFLLSSEVDLHAALFASRNGRNGTAIVIEMPKRSVRHENLQGPEFYLSLPCVSLCIPSIALTPISGSGILTEECDQIVGDTLHGLRPRATLGMQFAAEENYSVPAHDIGDGSWEIPRGVLAYRCFHVLRVTRTQTPRCDTPKLTLNAGLISLDNGTHTPDAMIYFTVDGKYPSAVPIGGVASQQYLDLIPAVSGQVLRWAAYMPDGSYQASTAGYFVVP